MQKPQKTTSKLVGNPELELKELISSIQRISKFKKLFASIKRGLISRNNHPDQVNYHFRKFVIDGEYLATKVPPRKLKSVFRQFINALSSYFSTLNTSGIWEIEIEIDIDHDSANIQGTVLEEIRENISFKFIDPEEIAQKPEGYSETLEFAVWDTKLNFNKDVPQPDQIGLTKLFHEFQKNFYRSHKAFTNKSVSLSKLGKIHIKQEGNLVIEIAVASTIVQSYLIKDSINLKQHIR